MLTIVHDRCLRCSRWIAIERVAIGHGDRDRDNRLTSIVPITWRDISRDLPIGSDRRSIGTVLKNRRVLVDNCVKLSQQKSSYSNKLEKLNGMRCVTDSRQTQNVSRGGQWIRATTCYWTVLLRCATLMKIKGESENEKWACGRVKFRSKWVYCCGDNAEAVSSGRKPRFHWQVSSLKKYIKDRKFWGGGW